MGDDAWTDEALRKGSEDTLGRLPYARRAAELIHAVHSPESSAVFGLSGPWGSGKTSLVNMIVEELQSIDPEWAIARFTPWATSDISGLLGEFYASLGEALPKKRGRQVRQALAMTATVAAPAAKLLPVAGEVAAEGVRVAGAALGRSPSWQAAFEKASKELREIKKPILVVVDDIDRLHVDELMALLKVVRLLGRFDGVQYLLAYDDETLFRTMTTSGSVTSHDGSAERFMEKIVQYPLFVPPLLQHQQLARLSEGFAGISRQGVDDGAHEDRLSGLVDCFVSLLLTPRAIDRYIAHLRHHLPLLPTGEVDDEDVHLLSLIRVCFPALFAAIPQYRNELTSGHTGQIKFDAREMMYESFDITPLLAVVLSPKRDVARRLLISLFPKVRAEGQFSTHASHRRQSIQHLEYFDRYFAMGILDHDVSDATVTTAIQAAAGGNGDALRELLLDATDGLRDLALSKGTGSKDQPRKDSGRTQLAEVLVKIANELPPDDSGPFSEHDRILTWVADLIVALDKSTSPESVLDVIGKCDDMSMRIRAWRRVQNLLEGAGGADRPAWYEPVTTELAQQAIANFLNHLKQGDDAAAEIGVGYQVQFVLRHDPDSLRARVHQLLDSGETDLSYLASRLVSVRTVSGLRLPDWQLSADFEQETFNQLAPPGDGPWYHEPVQEVDVRDLSWSNRRRFAAGRVKPPT